MSLTESQSSIIGFPQDQVETFLLHYGVKGMRWGVRKRSDEDSADRKALKKFDLKNPKVRNAAIAAVGITAIAAGAFIAARYNIKLRNMPSSTMDKGKEKAESILEDASDYIYLSKPFRGSGSRTTLSFVSKGQTKDYFKIFDDAGLNSDSFQNNSIRKMANGDVAAMFSDMFGRIDDATRPIPHAVLIPASKAVGLNSIEDVIEKHGPELEKRYLAYVAERVISTPKP